MKNQYLEEIKEALQDLEASKEDIKDILNDISGLYDDALEKGKTDEEIIKIFDDYGQEFTLSEFDQESEIYQNEFICMSILIPETL